MPLGHIGINVADLRGAKGYYDAIMPFLGYREFVSADDQFAYQPAEGARGTFLFFYTGAGMKPYSRQAGGLQHLAFMVPSRSAVVLASDQARALDSEMVHMPREFPEYPPPYYAAFWRDPFGLMLEAVCHYDRD